MVEHVTTNMTPSAWIADAKLGRYKTIHVAIVISTVGHVVLTAASAPSVITKTDSAFAAFIIGLLTLCVGTGFFKANISPMLAEQNTDTRLRVEVRKGERVIVDPAVTNARIFMYFYFCINIGSLAGQISMVFAEKYVSWPGRFLTLFGTDSFRSGSTSRSCCRPSSSSSAPSSSGRRRSRYVPGHLSPTCRGVEVLTCLCSLVQAVSPDWVRARDVH